MPPDPLVVAQVAETVRATLRNTDDPDEFRRYLYELKDTLYETEFDGDLDEELHQNLSDHVEWVEEKWVDSIDEDDRSDIIDDVHRVERFCQRRGRSKGASIQNSEDLSEPVDDVFGVPDSEEGIEGDDGDSFDDADYGDTSSVDTSMDDLPPATEITTETADEDVPANAGRVVSDQTWVEDEPADFDDTTSEDSATLQLGSDRPDWFDSDHPNAVPSWRSIEWPYGQPPKNRSGYFPNAEIANSVYLSKQFTVGDSHYIYLVVDNETVYVSAGGLYAFDRQSGYRQWSISSPRTKRHFSRPLLESDGNTMWVGAAGRTVDPDVTLRCIDTESGDIIDEIDVGPAIESYPIQAGDWGGDTIIIGCNRGTVRAYSTFHNSNEWTIQTEEGVHHSPAIEDGLGVVCDSGGNVIAFDVDEGTVEWERPYGEGATRPTIGNETVFLPLRDKIAALDLATGRRQYELPKGGYTTPSLAFAHNTLFVPGTLFDPNLHAYDVSDSETAGEDRWRANVSAKADPLVLGETLIVGAHDGIYAFDVSDGSQIWYQETDEKCVALAAAEKTGSDQDDPRPYILYAGLDDGSVYKVNWLWD